MFKHAFVRGIQTALVNAGRASFPDETTAHKVADLIADRVEIDLSRDIGRDVVVKVSNEVIAASDWFKGRPGFKAASFNKLSSWEDVHKLANHSVIQLMTKLAEGSTIEGGDKGNEEKQSPAGETKMDVEQRPPGYATDSLGKTEVDTKPGAVGKEEENPNKPARSDDKSNSPQEQSRTASETLRSLFKQAEGSTILGGDKGNKAMGSAEAKMDAEQRPSGYATFGVAGVGSLGEVMKQVKGPAVVGRETTQPNAPARTDDKSNSVQQHSAKAAAEDPYIALFKKTAAEVAEYLPASFDDDRKVAAVRACMGLNVVEKAHYLTGLQKEASEKTAAATPAAVPPGSRTDGYKNHTPEATHSRPGAYDGRGGNQGTKSAELPPFMEKKEEGEKKDDDKDKKDDDGKDKDKDKDLPPWMKHEEEKKAALKAEIERINAAQRSAA
jgi:hypothetical protein